MVHNDYLLKQFAILLMNLRDGLQPTGYVPGAPASLPARGSWAFAGRDAGAPGVAHADDCSVSAANPHFSGARASSSALVPRPRIHKTNRGRGRGTRTRTNGRMQSRAG